MEKIIIGVGYGSYSFNASTKEVTISGVTTVTLEQFLLIVNATQDTVIYNPTCADLGGTLSGSVLTLDYDTTAFSNTDDLQIHFALNSTTDSTSVLATEATLQDVLTAIQNVKIDTGDIDLNTDQIETKLDTGNTSLNNIDTNIGAKADASATTDTGTFSLISLFKRLLTKVTTLVSNQTDGSQKTKITDGAGVVNTKQLGTALTNTDVGLVTNTIIHGLSSSGGGTIVDVKVNPSGSLQTAIGDITGVVGQTTMANSLPVTIASNQTGIPVTDNGGSLTVDGSVTVSGTVTANTGLSQPLTDTQLRASNVGVSVSNFPSTQVVSGTVTANTGLSQPLTDAQLRASNVGVTVSNFPATQPVSGTVSANQSGTWDINNISGTVSLPTGAATSANQTTTNNHLAALNSLTPTQYDYINCTYTSGNLTGVVYKSGGSGGTTVSTLTLTYDVNNNLTSITKT